MPETATRGAGTADAVHRQPSTSATRPHPGASAGARLPHVLRGRIGIGLAGGFYPEPHRYDLFLSESCPHSLRISITLDLLGLDGAIATTVLTRPGDAPDAFAALRHAYEATLHHYDGPLTAPALRDRWSGRIVSNHTPDILRDLAGPLSGHDGDRPSRLRPPHLAAAAEAVGEALELHLSPAARPGEQRAALDMWERRLTGQPYALGGELTAADVDLWVALVHLGPPGTLCSHVRLRDYVRRLGEHPSFRGRTVAAPCTV
ncbi:glutathione S-transferase C-terminal domain-containing protein [Streptomyces sp. NPDC059740]|uniref:glutathione S-transferase C-terminal domain-containing protein n=1 Tax=Streptomyces sp. NPDC059740 TaxID=3346926 RepID=UPI003651967F